MGGYARLGSCALVVSGLLDFFTYALCAPYRLVALPPRCRASRYYSETTDGTQFDTLLETIAGLNRSLFCLFQAGAFAPLTAAD